MLTNPPEQNKPKICDSYGRGKRSMQWSMELTQALMWPSQWLRRTPRLILHSSSETTSAPSPLCGFAVVWSAVCRLYGPFILSQYKSQGKVFWLHTGNCQNPTGVDLCWPPGALHLSGRRLAALCQGDCPQSDTRRRQLVFPVTYASQEESSDATAETMWY